LNLSPFNIGYVFAAGVAWVLMLGYWILVCIGAFNLLAG
jgi:hypothetical protein